MRKFKVTVASDSTLKRTYETEVEKIDMNEIAMEYGRGESGELIEVSEDGELIDRMVWDTQYRKYCTWNKKYQCWN